MLGGKMDVDFYWVKWQHADNSKHSNEKDATHIEHEYKAGDNVLIFKMVEQCTHHKLIAPAESPSEITMVHINENVSIPCKHFIECINICWFKPHNNDWIHNNDWHHGGGCAGYIFTCFEIFENIFNFKLRTMHFK